MVILSTLIVQLSLGIKLGYAMPCEEHLNVSWDETKATVDPSGKKVKEFYLDSITGYWPAETFDEYKKIAHEIPIRFAKYWLEYNDSGSAMSENQHVESCVYQAKRKKDATGYTKFDYCVVDYLIANRCNTSAFVNGVSSQKSSSRSTSSNKSSSAGSSSQSNKKANRQATNSQSNQTSSNKPKPDPTGQMGDILGGVSETQASSNSNDLSKMTSNQLIDIATEAENSGDYARAYLAELQLSKSPDPKVSRQGLRQVSFRLRTGQGVAINRSESHRLAMQAANLGDVTAHSYVCADYLNGKGVEENHRKALDYCLFAAEKGDMKAQGNLGWLYESGEGVQHSPSLSNEWTCKAAAQGEPTALNNVKKAKINCN